MGLSVDGLWAFARQIHVCYKPRRMQWDGKKHRPIDPLYPEPKRILKKLHVYLQNNRLNHPSAHGGVRGRSCFSSARRHLGGRFVWTRDAADCYPSISPEAMRRELRALGFRYDTTKVLTLIFIYRDGVPQGSPVSGDALNLFFWRLDQLMASIAGSTRLHYSRAADDFVFSGKSRTAGEKVVERLEKELEARGIRVNEKKKRQSGLQTCSEERLVHSISISKPKGTAISREQSRIALVIAERYVAASRSVSADSIQAVAVKRAELAGWMYYCRQAESSPARALKQKLDAGDRHVMKKLRKIGISSKKKKWWNVHDSSGANEPRRLAIIWRHRLARSGQEKQAREHPVCTG